MITIKNIRTDGEDWEDIKVCRGTLWGNPYSHLEDSIFDTIKVESREIAIQKYKEYFYQKIDNKDPKFLKELNRLIIKNLRGEDITLACFCYPKKCHAEIIRDFLEQQEKIIE